MNQPTHIWVGVYPQMDYLNKFRIYSIFRWFQFTLKPLNSIAHEKFQLTIWYTSLWTLGQIWTQWTLRHIIGPILVIFDICHFLTIPEPFEYFLENQSFLNEGVII